MIRRLAAWAAPLTALLLAAGCANPLHDETPGEANGIATMSAREAIAAGEKAMAERKDLTYAGVQSVEGLANLPVTVSVLADGSCEMLVKSAKGRMDMRVLGKQMFVRVDAPAALAMLRLETGQARAVANKWIASPVDAETRESCNLRSAADKKLAETVKAGEVTVVAEREVRRFSGTDKDGDAVTVFLPTSGLPVPIEVTGRAKGGGFYRMTLVGYDRGLVIEAPKDVLNKR